MNPSNKIAPTGLTSMRPTALSGPQRPAERGVAQAKGERHQTGIPASPPAYRPQPAPKVLQTKPALNRRASPMTPPTQAPARQTTRGLPQTPTARPALTSRPPSGSLQTKANGAQRTAQEDRTRRRTNIPPVSPAARGGGIQPKMRASARQAPATARTSPPSQLIRAGVGKPSGPNVIQRAAVGVGAAPAPPPPPAMAVAYSAHWAHYHHQDAQELVERNAAGANGIAADVYNHAIANGTADDTKYVVNYNRGGNHYQKYLVVVAFWRSNGTVRLHSARKDHNRGDAYGATDIIRNMAWDWTNR